MPFLSKPTTGSPPVPRSRWRYLTRNGPSHVAPPSIETYADTLGKL
ncbi:MAG: hypothetical protein ACO2O1_02265 [Candidatus Caldarchaeales archaeon]